MSRGASTERPARARGLAILDRLVAEGQVAASLREEVLSHAERTESTAEESILQLGLMTETELLEYVAGMFETGFVSSEELARTGIDPWLLEMVPRKLVTRLAAFPLLYDRRAGVLSVVTAVIGDDDLRRQMQLATGAGHVKIYVAREASIRAAIARHYDQDDGPFELLLSGAHTTRTRSTGNPNHVPAWERMERPANDQRAELPVQTGARAAQGRAAIEQLPVPTQNHEIDVRPEVYLETMSVLVTLIEQFDRDRAGHSRMVARVCERITEQIPLTSAQAQGILIAAYLHDVGVPVRSHVTAFDAEKNDAKRKAAQRVYMAPNRLFDSVSLPENAVQTLQHRFERFDGAGFPDGLASKDIPLGARILSVVESYVDLTLNGANVLGRRLAAENAYGAIAALQGSVFDPEVVEWLRDVVLEDGSSIIVKTPEVLDESPRIQKDKRGVSGSLQEMALSDLIQILANGRKSGRLEVSSGGVHGEMFFQRGSIHDARLGDLHGADAVYAILRFREGSFSLVPADVSVEDAIGIPTHHLVLEAMRRLDEDQR